MKAIVTVPFFDTKENERGDITRKVLSRLLDQVKSPHVIVPVDNGSTDISTWNWIEESGLFPEAIRLIRPRSTASGVNAGWVGYHEQLVSGSAIAVKYDSDIFVDSDNWLDLMLETISNNPQIGIIGPRARAQDYTGKWLLNDHGDWWETSFVYGAIAVRSAPAFRAIGYMKQPYGKWGWDDHWDVARIKYTNLCLAVMSNIEWVQVSRRSCLNDGDKEECRTKGKKKFLEMKRGLSNGKINVYQHPSFCE